MASNTGFISIITISTSIRRLTATLLTIKSVAKNIRRCAVEAWTILGVIIPRIVTVCDVVVVVAAS